MAGLVRAVSASLVAASVALAAFSPVAVRAGTTGTIAGRIVDANTSAAVAGARVSVASPSQSENTTTDANGSFQFLSLAPDTYTVVVERAGYQNLVLAGVTVQADQTQTLNRAVTSLQRIGGTTVRRATDLVKPGTTSDVYSVNGALQDATQALGGPGGLSNAYSAIQSIPGTVVQQGQQGWYQQLSIRGGDIDQVGYELDGIPVNRVYDNAPQTMLSALGQQELQVYTGGTPATSDGQGLSGYVNQVIKTGTIRVSARCRLGSGRRRSSTGSRSRPAARRRTATSRTTSALRARTKTTATPMPTTASATRSSSTRSRFRSATASTASTSGTARRSPARRRRRRSGTGCTSPARTSTRSRTRRSATTW